MTKTRQLLLSLALFALHAAVGLSRQRVDNLVYFGGDSWEYQSMAVNFVHGHGMKAGGVLPFERYRFSSPPQTPELPAHFEAIGREPGRYHTYRTPGFPALAALVYTVGGVHPVLVYRAQLLLLALVAALLPWVASRAHGPAGVAAGLIAGAGLMLAHARFADTFLTEVLIIATLFALYWLAARLRERPGPGRAAALGLAAGAALLVKGSMIFIPPLLGLWLLVETLRRRLAWPALFAAAAGMAAIPAAWSVYVSREAGRPVFISTQGNAVLLEGNNELCFKDGGWHWEYSGTGRFWAANLPDTSGLYYNQPGVKDLSVGQKLAGFYARHWRRIPGLWLNKLGAAYADLWAIRAWAALLCLLALRDLLARRLPARAAGALAAGAALAAWLALPPSIYAVTGLWIVAGAAAALWLWLGARPESRPPVDPALWIIAANFALLTVMIFGLRRFTAPGDALLWLAALLTLAHAARLLRRDLSPAAR